MHKPNIRPLALCVFRHHNKILVMEGYDSQKDQLFYRPLGGGIEFGEYSWDAIRREIREELGEEIKNLSFLGTTENIFHFEGTPGHEVIFLFEADFADPSLYQQDTIIAQESNGQEIKAVWKPIDAFGKGRSRYALYPEGLVDTLQAVVLV